MPMTESQHSKIVMSMTRANAKITSFLTQITSAG